MTPRLFPPGVPASKRMFDLLLTTLGLLVISPLLMLLALAVLITLGRPVLFRQARPGLNGEPFTIFKFRTMRPAKDGEQHPEDDERRLTRFGRFMRSFSLDELPELFNVLRGEMSLVGPRPLLMRYLDRYSAEQMRRHDVLPGITGWAQVKGRNVLAWADKFQLDLWYVDNWSLALDIKILAITLWKVVSREGISAPGHPSAPEFKGSAAEPNSAPDGLGPPPDTRDSR